MFAADRTSARSSRVSVRRAGRVHAALTALAFVLSSLVGLVHESATRHVQCAEHGEQIHSDAAPVVAIAGDAAQLALRSQPAAAIHGHEHCLMASATRESRIAPAPPAIATADAASAVVAAIVPHVAVVAYDRVYRTAPKTSPPA